MCFRSFPRPAPPTPSKWELHQSLPNEPSNPSAAAKKQPQTKANKITTPTKLQDLIISLACAAYSPTLLRENHTETESSGESRVQVCSRAWASNLVLHFIRKHATRNALHGRVTAAPERNTCSIEPCWRNFRDIDLKAWSPCEKVTHQPGIEPGSH